MERIILDNGDGSVKVLVPSPNTSLTIEEIIEKDSEGKPYEVVDVPALPDDRYFRAAWKAKAGGVDVDMTKARNVHMTHIRVQRDEKLKEKDLEYMRADEQNDGQLKAQIAQEKQALRDLPQTFDLSGATTPDELKALWPTELS